MQNAEAQWHRRLELTRLSSLFRDENKLPLANQLHNNHSPFRKMPQTRSAQGVSDSESRSVLESGRNALLKTGHGSGGLKSSHFDA